MLPLTADIERLPLSSPSVRNRSPRLNRTQSKRAPPLSSSRSFGAPLHLGERAQLGDLLPLVEEQRAGRRAGVGHEVLPVVPHPLEVHPGGEPRRLLRRRRGRAPR